MGYFTMLLQLLTLRSVERYQNVVMNDVMTLKAADCSI
jgi:hypothetical protein